MDLQTGADVVEAKSLIICARQYAAAIGREGQSHNVISPVKIIGFPDGTTANLGPAEAFRALQQERLGRFQVASRSQDLAQVLHRVERLGVLRLQRVQQSGAHFAPEIEAALQMWLGFSR